MPTRKASAEWTGGLKDGSGSYNGESKTLGGSYSFGSRFENGSGSNPEELLAAAEAACFSMALAAALERAGTPARSVQTDAACTIEKVGDDFKITKMRLTVRAEVDGIDEATLRGLADKTKTGCPVSKALGGNVEFDVTAELASG